MHQFFSTVPPSASRKSNSVKSSQTLFSLPSYPTSLSISPESISDHHHHSILHRQPTFSYIPIHKRRRSGGSSSSSSSLSGSRCSIDSLSISSVSPPFTDSSSDGLLTPGSSDNELLMPTSPTSSIFDSSMDSMEYTSFPNLEKFSDECWTEIRVEKCDPDEIQLESYDEMFVGGVRFQY